MNKSMLGMYLTLPILLFAPSITFSTTVSTTPAGTGSLTYTSTSAPASCHVNDHTYNFHKYTLSAFSYKDPTGVSYPVGSTYIVTVGSPQVGNCPKNGPSYSFGSNFIEEPNSYALNVSVNTSAVVSGSVAVEPTSSGWINPKYKIVGVLYAPPGSSSTVSYSSNSVVGSSAAFSSSFSTEVGQSISLSKGFSLYGFTDKQTTTSSSSYNQEQDSSSSIAVTQTTSSGTNLTGYSDPVNGINHDYDYIFAWLNPIVNFTLYTDQTGKDQALWTGYGYDLNDLQDYPDMDVIGIQLGCLNGDFYQQYVNGSNTNWVTCEDTINNNFSRTWALNNADGSGPALTPTLAGSAPPYNFCQEQGSDLYYLCQADPFSNTLYAQQEFPPPVGSSTTADGRFTACGNSQCNATIQYEPGVTKPYSQGYSVTSTQSEGYKNTYKVGYSMETQFGLTETGCDPNSDFCVSFGRDTMNSKTYTWIDQFSQTTNNSNGQTASFNIVGPAEGYSGPEQFVVYQDNLYGTFMFFPGN